MSTESKASQLSALGAISDVVSDTGEVEAIKAFTPKDATTNPSLILKASELKQYEPLLVDAITYAIRHAVTAADRLSLAMDKLAVNFGAEIAKIVPGYVSTEVDARLSFNTQASVTKARALIALYNEVGIGKDRILIKLASTWEGIRASEILEREGIHTNLTLLFALPQAIACAEAGSTLISPFVGRIFDWFVKNGEKKTFEALEDPGVKSVTAIYNWLKKHGYKTIVMGASFRNKGQIVALAGCDKLTIAPKLLEELKASSDPITRYLLPAMTTEAPPAHLTESEFRFQMNEDPMATEKLAEGIRLFAADCIKLEKLLQARL